MMKDRYGRVINIGSVVGMSGNAGQTNYSATKSALLGFTKSLAREVASRNITVNIISPGFIPNEICENLPSGFDDIEKLASELPKVLANEQIVQRVKQLEINKDWFFFGTLSLIFINLGLGLMIKNNWGSF